MNIAAPAGAIVSTARDMSRWMMWHLSGGAVPPTASGQLSESTRTPPRRLIQKDRLWETYRECNRAYSRHYEPAATNASDQHVAYDLGWITSNYRGTKRFLANVNSRSRSLYAIARPSVVCLSSICLSSVCNVRAPYSGGSDFQQYFYGIRYLGHPWTSTENFTEIVPGEPLRRGS